MLAIKSFRGDVDAQSVSREILDNGCAIVENLASSQDMDRLRDELQPYLDTAPIGKTDFAGRTSRRRNSLLSKSPTCRELATHPLTLAVCENVLGPHCVDFRLHVTALVELLPGEIQQGIHRDGGLYPVRHPQPPLTLATFWAYTDFTVENGATLVAPGSHRWEHEREPEEHELVNAVMPAGSVLIYTSSVWHGSGANRSNGPRTGMALHYNLGWLNQEENQLLSALPEVAKQFSDRLQRLIGYDLQGPYLGFIEAGNPHQLLEDSPSADYARTEDRLDKKASELNLLTLTVDGEN